jgi:hypothetical protein
MAACVDTIRYIHARLMIVASVVVSTSVIGTFGIIESCAAGDEQSVSETVATVNEILGIASLRVTLNGKSETLRILPLANEEELQSAGKTWNAVTQRHERVISKADIERFLRNRAMIMNFLRCITPPQSTISLRGIQKLPVAGIGASVAFHHPTGRKVDLTSTMLAEGFAMPEPRLWGYMMSEKYPPSNDDDAVEFFYSVPKSDCGLWLDARPRARGYIPLSENADPALAVPLPTFRFDTKSESGALRVHRIGVTVILRRADDAGEIACAAWQINDDIRKLTSEYSDADVMADTFAVRVENEVLAHLTSLSDGHMQLPSVTKVQVRLRSVEFAGKEMGTRTNSPVD